MKKHEVQIKETIATVIADEEFIPLAEAEIVRQRNIIESYIHKNPRFATSLEPYPVSPDAPEIIRRMAEATSKVGVGPMAAVAGAIAEFSLLAMTRAGAKHAIVDNGGDIALALLHPTVVAIFTGPAKIQNIGLKFLPQPALIGICTSSGTVGHSLSFGRADAAMVVAKNACLADAAATALGNAIKDKDSRRIKKAMQSLMIEGIEGMLVIIDDVLAICGNLPQLVRVNMAMEKISGARKKKN